MKPHQEETKIINLGVGEEKKKVKVGTGMTTPKVIKLKSLRRIVRVSWTRLMTQLVDS